MKKIAQLENEADNLLQSLLEISPSHEEGSTSEQKNVIPNQEETYQLPVRVGIKNQSIDEGDTPWIVGRFSPNAPTDKNHPKGHNGVDLKAPKDTPVYPIASGIVLETGNGAISGNYVKVAHENGAVISYYGHLNSVECQKGQQVTKQTVIGKVGNSGNARFAGFHLHYEVKINGSLINPLNIAGKIVGSLSKKANLFIRIEKLANIFDIFQMS